MNATPLDMSNIASKISDLLNPNGDETSKLAAAVSTAESMFQSNVQCLTHILSLKKELADTKEEAEAIEAQLARDASEERERFERRIVVLEDTIKAQQTELEQGKSMSMSEERERFERRIVMLEDTIKAQQAELEQSKNITALHGMWKALLSSNDLALPTANPFSNPIVLQSPMRQSNDALKISDSTAAASALCMLTTHIAREVVVASAEASASLGTVVLPAESLLMQLLQHTWTLQGAVDGRLESASAENAKLRERAQNAEDRYAQLLQKMQLQQSSSGDAATKVQFSSDLIGPASGTGTPIDDYKTFMRTMVRTPADSQTGSEVPSAAAVVARAAPSTPLRLFDSPSAIDTKPTVTTANAKTEAAMSASPAPVRTISPSRYEHVTSPVLAYINGNPSASASHSRSRAVSPAPVHLHAALVAQPSQSRITSPNCQYTNTKTTTTRASSPKEMSRYELPTFLPNAQPTPSRGRLSTPVSAHFQREVGSTHAQLQSPCGALGVTSPSPKTPIATGNKRTPLHGAFNTSSAKTPSPSSDSVIFAVTSANAAVAAAVAQPGPCPPTPPVRHSISYSPRTGRVDMHITQVSHSLDTTLVSNSKNSIENNENKISLPERVRTVMHHSTACKDNTALPSQVYVTKQKFLQDLSGQVCERRAPLPKTVSPPVARNNTVVASVTPEDTSLSLAQASAVLPIPGNQSVGYISDDSMDDAPSSQWSTPQKAQTQAPTIAKSQLLSMWCDRPLLSPEAVAFSKDMIQEDKFQELMHMRPNLMHEARLAMCAIDGM